MAKTGRRKATPNPRVDQVITLTDAWRQKPHRRRLSYFIPEWDDLVDPDYDFETDTHAGGTGDWSNETYAHQLYPMPNYDGLLVSRVIAEKTRKKAERIRAMGVHRYLRVPPELPIMGDCGAFEYITEPDPPFTTGEILDYYTDLGFDIGVSIDHLIVKATMDQRDHRYQLTLQNAAEFIREHRARQLTWTPMAAVQGWSPETYAEGARQCVAMGYPWIGLGGLVRSSTKAILEVLEAVHAVVPEAVGIHCFGLARIQSMKRFADLGVRSVDSASLLRRAWMGNGQNYLTEAGVFYGAIRIPEAGKSFRAKRIVSEGRATAEQVQRMERAGLGALKAFDRGEASVQAVLDALGEYDQLITPDRPDHTPMLRRTLEDAPWQRCPCAICQKDGIQVIIFRGNNRNRRRGFHNTWSFYGLLQRALDGEDLRFRHAGRD